MLWQIETVPVQSFVIENNNCSFCLRVFSHVLVFSQQLGTRDVKDSDDAGAEATREDVLTGMEGHWAGAVFWYKVIQLSTGNNKTDISYSTNISTVWSPVSSFIVSVFLWIVLSYLFDSINWKTESLKWITKRFNWFPFSPAEKSTNSRMWLL